MRFGIREICDVVFKAKSTVTIGSKTFKKGQPVLYIDSAKTSTIEGAATTVYATGGRGNTRLISWEGEKTLTFTVEDALLSPIGFSILSGAGLFDHLTKDEKVHVHRTTITTIDTDGISLSDALGEGETICESAPCFVVLAEDDGSLTGKTLEVEVKGNMLNVIVPDGEEAPKAGTTVFCDYYVLKAGSAVSELQIDAANFAGYYYVEASTLFRRQNDGKDLPAEITFPNVKIQSNFTFTMASTGDPSTFTFTMDAMPGYTYFDKTKKVLCVMQIVNESTDPKPDTNSVMAEEDFHEEMTEKADATKTLGEVTGLKYDKGTGVLTWTAAENADAYEVEWTDNTGTYDVTAIGTSYVIGNGATAASVTPHMGKIQGKTVSATIQ